MEEVMKNDEKYECTDCGSEVDMNATVCTNCGIDFNKKVLPWSRWFARILDGMLLGAIISIILGIIKPEILAVKFIFLNMIVSFIYIFIEASLLVVWGTTPGKYLLNIKLIPLNQVNFTFELALKRSFKVWFFGLGLGFPILTIIFSIVQFQKLKENKITSWDKSTGVNVIHEANSTKNNFIFVVVFVLLFLLRAYFLGIK